MNLFRLKLVHLFRIHVSRNELRVIILFSRARHPKWNYFHAKLLTKTEYFSGWFVALMKRCNASKITLLSCQHYWPQSSKQNVKSFKFTLLMYSMFESSIFHFQRSVQHIREGWQGREPCGQMRQRRKLWRIGTHVQHAKSCHNSGSWKLILFALAINFAIHLDNMIRISIFLVNNC